MPRLRPPAPAVAQRGYYVRMEKPLALTMERYAEFLGTDNLDDLTSHGLNSPSNPRPPIAAGISHREHLTYK